MAAVRGPGLPHPATGLIVLLVLLRLPVRFLG